MTMQTFDQTLTRQIEQIASEEQRSPEQIVAAAIQLYLTQAKKMPGVLFLLSLAGQGASGEHDVSERDEAILVAEIDPVKGWRA